MSGIPVKKLATYEDVWDLPENMVGEVVEGTLYAHPRPTTAHARASSRLGVKLGSAFEFGSDGPGGWIFLDEPELHLGLAPDILVPDLAGWRRERIPHLPDDAYLTISPDWLCEVLSRSTEAVDRTVKMPVYAREGVKYIWLIHPGQSTLEVFALEAQQWALRSTHQGAQIVHAEPFEAVAFDLSVLWAR